MTGFQKRSRLSSNGSGQRWIGSWEPIGVSVGAKVLPEYNHTPGQINVVEILRLWMYAKALDLVDWGKMRYNLLGGNGGHWFPGEMADRMNEKQLLKAVSGNPFASRLPSILREAHQLLFEAPKQRLSQS